MTEENKQLINNWFSQNIKMAIFNGDVALAELEHGRQRLLEEPKRRRLLTELLLGRDFTELMPNGTVPFDWFEPFTDQEAIEWYVHCAHRKYTITQASRIIGQYRCLTVRQGVSEAVPLHYLACAGVTLKQHMPMIGPCVQDFKYLQEWEFNDVPTEKSLVSWVPCLTQYSMSKNAKEQLVELGTLRGEMELPDHHLSSFGSATIIAGLMLAHYRTTKEKVPSCGYWVRTDTRMGFDSLSLYWNDGQLRCDSGYWSENERRDGVGVLALGVELGK